MVTEGEEMTTPPLSLGEGRWGDTIQQECSGCKGTGIKVTALFTENPCTNCAGAGKVGLLVLDPASVLSAIADVQDKCNAIKNKLDNTKDKVDQIWDKVKTL